MLNSGPFKIDAGLYTCQPPPPDFEIVIFFFMIAHIITYVHVDLKVIFIYRGSRGGITPS